jgi:branched-subunit amino acid transport protein
MMWAGVLLGAAGCYALKLLGLSVPRRVVDHPQARHITDLLPVALLAALTVTQTFSDGRELVLDARVVGVAAALVAIKLRAPFIVVVVLAAAVTAVVRAVG